MDPNQLHPETLQPNTSEPVLPPTQTPAGQSPLGGAPNEIEETKKISKRVLLILFLVLLILVPSGIFLYSKYKPETYKSVSFSPTPVSSPKPSAKAADSTANWKTYFNTDLSFKYPPSLTASVDIIQGTNPSIKIVAVDKDSTLINECMQSVSTENRNNVYIEKFNRVTTGEMCLTSDASPRETWITPSSDAYAPGISFSYSVNEEEEVNKIFENILSTFKFLATPSGDQVACTQEAKLCSDGSYVSREGPNCEFKACPN